MGGGGQCKREGDFTEKENNVRKGQRRCGKRKEGRGKPMSEEEKRGEKRKE
jgi:hypothetical protein